MEERPAGKNIGGKSLTVFAGQEGLELRLALARLRVLGAEVKAEDSLKAIAERAGVRHIEIAKLLLVPGYRLPEKL